MIKYHSVRTYSQLCGRFFASKLECKRAEELWLLQLAGEISGLEFQRRFVLSTNPRVSISLDFCYVENGKTILEDSKGFLTRDFRTKMAWLKNVYGLDVRLSR